ARAARRPGSAVASSTSSSRRRPILGCGGAYSGAVFLGRGAACSSRPNSSASSRANSALGRPRTASDRQTLMHRCAQPAAETPRQQQRPEPSLSSLQMHRPPAEGLAPEQWDGKQLDVSSCSSTASALSAKTGSRVAAYVETAQDRGAPTPRGQEFGGGGSLLGTATPGSSPRGHRGVRPNRFLMSDKSPTPFLHEKVEDGALTKIPELNYDFKFAEKDRNMSNRLYKFLKGRDVKARAGFFSSIA
ncbi:unnamed protein product, partial [Polarella glacialis]